MSMYSLSDAASVGADRPARQALAGWVQNSGPGVAAGIAWIAFGLACLVWNDVSDWSRTLSLGIGAFVVAAFILLGTLSAEHLSGAGRALRLRAPWLAVLGVLFTLWELATAKFAWLPLPFFPPPQAIIEVYTDDLPKLLDSVFASVKLQLGGYVIGATLGFVTGVSIGWSRSVGYWVHPLLRFIGPLPATAWLPIAFFTFPSSWSASTFLIALATGFPVTVLTWSGGGERQQFLLRRRAHARSQAVVPGAEGGDPGGAATCLCRPVHGARLILCGAGRGGDDRR